MRGLYGLEGSGLMDASIRSLVMYTAEILQSRQSCLGISFHRVQLNPILKEADCLQAGI